MKKLVFNVVLFFMVASSFAQDVTYTEIKNPELSKAIAKLTSGFEAGFKNHLVRVFVGNESFGYTQNESPEGAKQYLYISLTNLKDNTTLLFKTNTFINVEVIEVADAPNGYFVRFGHGLIPEERIEETLEVKVAKPVSETKQ
jgi:uncharacterized Fe-S cluster-containing MiaB family protein